MREHMSAQTLLSHDQRELLIAQLQEDYDGTVTETSLDELARTREAILMEETAFVMGIEHGIIGSENPDVLPLYSMAMPELSRMRKETTATAMKLPCNRNYICPRGGCNVESFSGDKYTANLHPRATALPVNQMNATVCADTVAAAGILLAKTAARTGSVRNTTYAAGRRAPRNFGGTTALTLRK